MKLLKNAYMVIKKRLYSQNIKNEGLQTRVIKKRLYFNPVIDCLLIDSK